MHPDLQLLIQLQDLDLQIFALQDQSSKIPQQIASIDSLLAEHDQAVKAAKDRLEKLKKERRAAESDVEALQNKLSRYREQLMQVKTNKEYTAMLHEMEAAQREVRSKEDEILAMMESIEATEATLAQGEAALKSATQINLEKRREVESTQGSLSRQTAALESRRGDIERQVTSHLLEQYRRIAAARRGIAVAEARDQACQVCHVVMRPQVFNDLKRGVEIFTCDSCNRILYFRDSDQASSTAAPVSGA